MAKIFSALEDVRDGIIRPAALMPGMITPCAAGSAKFQRSGRRDFLLCQYPGNSGRAIACQTQTVYLLDNRGGFLIYNEIAVLVHEIAVYRLTGGGLSAHPLGSLGGSDFLAGVPNEPLIEQVSQWSQVVVAVCTVYRIVDCNETNAVLRKDHFRVHTDLQIVSTEP